MAARRLGIERLVLKTGKMRLFFVGDDNKSYYQSRAFGKVLAYLQANPLRCELRDIKGKRSILVNNVPTVDEALKILDYIETLNPL